ncbi:unknown [Methanoculleus sp. CAG:1088]|nr:unknown [Methanoculleus sp. CAG:1088]
MGVTVTISPSSMVIDVVERPNAADLPSSPLSSSKRMYADMHMTMTDTAVMTAAAMPEIPDLSLRNDALMFLSGCANTIQYKSVARVRHRMSGRIQFPMCTTRYRAPVSAIF